MQRLKPERIKLHNVSGRIIDSGKDWVKFIINTPNQELKEELVPRIQKVKKTKNNIYTSLPASNHILLRYLTTESMKGLYKSSEKNLPYEILDRSWGLIYRQEALIKTKEKIFNELEKAAIDERLRN